MFLRRFIKKITGDPNRVARFDYIQASPQEEAVAQRLTRDPVWKMCIRDRGYSFISAEVEYIPTTGTSLTNEESVSKMQRLIDMLEENDDVQAVWHNWDNMPD